MGSASSIYGTAPEDVRRTHHAWQQLLDSAFDGLATLEALTFAEVISRVRIDSTVYSSNFEPLSFEAAEVQAEAPAPAATPVEALAPAEAPAAALAPSDDKAAALAPSDDKEIADGDLGDRQSHRSEFDVAKGGSFFGGIDQGALHASADDGLASTDPTPQIFSYKSGYEIVHGGVLIGSFGERLGQGGLGTVYSFRLASGRQCAAKAVREDMNLNMRTKLEKALASECAIAFASGRSSLTATVIRMVAPIPGFQSTAKGALILCDLIDAGDLEQAMKSDKHERYYRGKLYTCDVWPLESVAWMTYQGCAHMHERGIIHQDLKPANIMLCLNGLVKITDFGLAGFSRVIKKDPWTKRETPTPSARLQGGTPDYMSPEQKWLVNELQTKARESKSEYDSLKSSWPVTPATSDIFQAAVAVLEMYSRQRVPAAADKQLALIAKCVARRPEADVASLSTHDTTEWLTKELGLAVLTGVVTDKRICGAQLLELLGQKLSEFKDVFAVSIAQAKKIQLALLGSICSTVDAMNPTLAAHLQLSLSQDVSMRPNSVNAAFRCNDFFRSAKKRVPAEAQKQPMDHGDDDVAGTLGGIAQSMVAHGASAEACDVCAQWLGVVSWGGFEQAFDAFCNLWKRHGDALTELELSRAAPNGYWKKDMLAGSNTAARLAQAVQMSRSITRINVSEQKELDVDVFFDALFSNGGPTSLQELYLKGCSGFGLQIPAVIGNLICPLIVLDMQDCKFEGPTLPKTLLLLALLAETLEKLFLNGNKLGGMITTDIAPFDKLTELSLVDMALRGPLPTMPVSLEWLKLGRWIDTGDERGHKPFMNEFTGTFPKEWSELSNLKTLVAADCGLSGPLPPLPSSLVQLDIEGGFEGWDRKRHECTGGIPAAWSSLTKLESLCMRLCTLDRPLPKELGNMISLTSLDLNTCKISGELPKELGNMISLTSLILLENEISGDLPKELGNLTNLKTLSLRNNKMSGELPKELSNLTNLEILSLRVNQFSGNLPEELCNLTNLKAPMLNDNAFSVEEHTKARLEAALPACEIKI